MWGVKRTTEAAEEQAESQRQHADEQWRRAQRQEAYVAFLEAADALNDKLGILATRLQSDKPVEDSEWWAMEALDVQVGRAGDRIRITGSDPVETTAEALIEVLFNMGSALFAARNRAVDSRLGDYELHAGKHYDAYKAFQMEAKETLGFLDPYRPGTAEPTPPALRPAPRRAVR